jgi:hypothetical protein
VGKQCFERPSLKDIYGTVMKKHCYFVGYCMCLPLFLYTVPIICGVLFHLLLNPSTATASAKWTGILVQKTSVFHLSVGFSIREKKRIRMRLLGYTTFAYYMASLWTSVQDIGFPCLLTLQLINKNKNRRNNLDEDLGGTKHCTHGGRNI